MAPMFYITLVSTLFFSVNQSDGLRCYNCHSKCSNDKEGKLNCESVKLYLNSISYDDSRDGHECPTEYAGWSDPKYIEECEADSFCGKREISIHVRLSSEEKENGRATTTSYPILRPERMYHRVFGCMRPKIDCDRKVYDKVIRSKSSSKNETITISGKIVEEADCRKCQQDLCNAEEPHNSTTKPPGSFASRNGAVLTWILSALIVTTAAKFLTPI